MRRLREWIWLLGIATVVVACVGGPSVLVPAPTPTVSPLLAPKALMPQVYLPLAYGVRHAHPKRGVGLTYGYCEDVFALRVSWYYAWGVRPIQCTGAVNVPMIWGRSDVERVVVGGGDWLLGFNEPDRDDQSNLSPLVAAQLWRRVEILHGNTWKLVSPAPSHVDLGWLYRFRNEYIKLYGEPPKLDALAVHCYLITARECKSIVAQATVWAKEWGIPGGVWITEFAFQESKTPNWIQETDDFISWLDANSDVARYAWFATRIYGTEPWACGLGESLIDVETSGHDVKLTPYGQNYTK